MSPRRHLTAGCRALRMLLRPGRARDAPHGTGTRWGHWGLPTENGDDAQLGPHRTCRETSFPSCPLCPRHLLRCGCAAAAGFPAGGGAAAVGLGLRGPWPCPPAGWCYPRWGVGGKGKGTRRRGRKQQPETVSGKEEFIPFFLMQGCWSPASAAGGAASCRAGQSPGGWGPSSLGGAGAPWTRGPCRGRERRGDTS